MTSLVYRGLLTATVLASACSTGARVPQRNPNVITVEEIAAANLPTAYETVERLRPQFLRTRGASTPLIETRPVVYQDNLNLGGVEMLRQIRSADIQEIRFLGASDATTRFGTGHPGGAIVVTSKVR